MRKKIRRLSDVIDIKRSKENDGIILKQALIYTPKKCEDCPRICKFRRVVTSRCHFTYKTPFWAHQCNVCKSYYNIVSKKFNTNFLGVMTHFQDPIKKKR